MIRLRPFVIVGIIVLFGTGGIFLYTEYSNRKFETSLPSPPLVSEQATIPTLVEPLKEDTPMKTPQTTDTHTPAEIEQASALEKPETETELEAVETALEGDSVFVPEESYEMSREEMDQAFEIALSYTFTDIDETYAQLEEALRTKFGDNEHIRPFLNAWKSSYFILEEVKNVSETGGNIDYLLTQVPAVVTSQLIETTIKLTNLSDAEAAEGRAIVANFTDTIDTMEILNDTKPLVEDAVVNGDITVEEAADFLRALGENVEVNIIHHE